MKKFSKIIIGSGPTGLGAGYFFKDNNFEDYLILEKEDYYGGLATSFIDDKGFTWDIGGHVQFSHYPYFDQVMLRAITATDWLTHERSSWVWMYDRFIPYPFQNNIHRLTKEALDDCLLGLENLKNQKISLQNFEDWILKSFGEGVAKHFLIPYNFKVWAYPPKMLNYSWVGERVATVDLERIKENIKLMRDDISWGPNNTFQFPRKGGTGAIWKNVAALVGHEKIKLNSKIFEIDKNKKLIKTNHGDFYYDEILSTMPVSELCKLITPESSQLKEKSNQLLYSSSHIVGIGLKGKATPSLADKCWMYFPESNCPFYRVTVFSNYSPNNVPDSDQYYSLMTETSSSSLKFVDDKKLIDEVVSGLINTKLINKSDESNIVSKWKYSARHGYPTPSLQRDEILDYLLPQLQQEHIYSRGRFGAWKYEVSNQDHSFMQGVEWADFILNQKAEKTLRINRHDMD